MEKTDNLDGTTERLLNAYATVASFLKTIEGSPEERAQKTAEMLQRFFPGSDPVALNALSALKTYCAARELDPSAYISSDLLKLLALRDNGKVSSPVMS